MVCLNVDQELLINLNQDVGGRLAALIKGAKYKDGSNVFPEPSKHAANIRVQSNTVKKARNNWESLHFLKTYLIGLNPLNFYRFSTT